MKGRKEGGREGGKEGRKDVPPPREKKPPPVLLREALAPSIAAPSSSAFGKYEIKKEKGMRTVVWNFPSLPPSLPPSSHLLCPYLSHKTQPGHPRRSCST